MVVAHEEDFGGFPGSEKDLEEFDKSVGQFGRNQFSDFRTEEVGRGYDPKSFVEVQIGRNNPWDGFEAHQLQHFKSFGNSGDADQAISKDQGYFDSFGRKKYDNVVNGHGKQHHTDSFTSDEAPSFPDPVSFEKDQGYGKGIDESKPIGTAVPSYEFETVFNQKYDGDHDQEGYDQQDPVDSKDPEDPKDFGGDYNSFGEFEYLN